MMKLKNAVWTPVTLPSLLYRLFHLLRLGIAGNWRRIMPCITWNNTVHTIPLEAGWRNAWTKPNRHHRRRPKLIFTANSEAPKRKQVPVPHVVPHVIKVRIPAPRKEDSVSANSGADTSDILTELFPTPIPIDEQELAELSREIERRIHIESMPLLDTTSTPHTHPSACTCDPPCSNAHTLLFEEL